MITDDQTSTSETRLKNIRRRKELRKRALKIVHNYTLLAGGIGFIPIPSFYQVAVGGLLGKMLYDLGKLYGTSLTRQKNKAIIAAVLGGAHSDWITVYLGNNIEKILPGMSVISNTIARPVVAAGITYAIGRLFVKHFDSGAWLREGSVPNLSLLAN